MSEASRARLPALVYRGGSYRQLPDNLQRRTGLLEEDPEEDREDTAETNVNTSRRITGSGRTDMNGVAKSPRLSKFAEAVGFREGDLGFLATEET